MLRDSFRIGPLRPGAIKRKLAAAGLLRRRGLVTLRLAQPEETDFPARRVRLNPQVTHTELALPRLPPEYDGLRVVHLTDIHHSVLVGLQEVERVVEIVNRSRPDVVALTGDYVTFSPACIWPVARVLGRLRAPRGVFAVLGNHDFRAGAGAMTRALEAQGIRVLRNANCRLGGPGGNLWLVGVDDVRVGRDDLPAALRGVPAGDTKILLCHNPIILASAARAGVDLVVSGHTHGGQIRLPWGGAAYQRGSTRLGRKSIQGRHSLRGTQMYVSRGIGTVWVPFRLACPPEIACLHFRRARPN